MINKIRLWLMFFLSININAMVLPENDNFYLLDLDGNEETIWHHENKNLSFSSFVDSYENYLPLKNNSIYIYSGSERIRELAYYFLVNNGYQGINQTTTDSLLKSNARLRLYHKDYSELSPLYNDVKQVTDDVYTFIGDPSQPTMDNYGHNNNISFIVGGDSVLVFNAGGSAILASTVHSEIKKITNLPIKYVVLENSQAHATLGSKYWDSIPGVNIVSNEITARRLATSAPMVSRAKGRLKSNFYGSGVVIPEITFKKELIIDLGGKKVKLNHLGPAHAEDDTLLYSEEDDLIITGDYTFNQRMLPIHSDTNIPSWLEIWEKIEGYNAKIVIPGHGDVTTMEVVNRDTYDYLHYIRGSIEDILDDDGELNDALDIDTKQFNHLRLYNLLNRVNIERVFLSMEFE